MEPQKYLKYLETEQSWRHHTSWFQNIYKALEVKTVWYWHKNRHVDQWIRIKNPEIILECIYSQLIFDKGAKNVQCEKIVPWCWENWMQKNEIGLATMENNMEVPQKIKI